VAVPEGAAGSPPFYGAHGARTGVHEEALPHTPLPRLRAGLVHVDETRCWALGVRRRARTADVPPVRPGAGDGARRPRGRTLRTAQEASWTPTACVCSASYEGHTVDALAPGAEEGRGGLR